MIISIFFIFLYLILIAVPLYNQLNQLFFLYIYSVTILSETVPSEANELASQSVPTVSTSTPGLSAPAGTSGMEERDDMFMDAGDR